jgi:threonine/homoserine/homoserine lactone efflux protein
LISQGKLVALATVASVTLGDIIVMSASLVGLGAIVLASATLFTVLKWIGAIFFVYLGVKILRSSSKALLGDLKDVHTISIAGVFYHAVTNLNPKSIVFFITFVSQFLGVYAPLLPQFAILVSTFNGLIAINAIAYALVADKFRSKITHPVVLAWLSRFGGHALVSMGSRLQFLNDENREY